ncbi:hypothetical protein GQ44DRAFT_765230 [Phaeosphaeriaceae sp. PMI808]|nr:hypothetical protein GQ44DRAFT_765230 [Phaeosphaeriaceae sp. PMI808]
MFSWLAAGNASTKAANCSDCSLGSMQTQLNSPFGYDEEFDQEFQAAKSSCGSSGYSFTTPTGYAVSTNLPDRAPDASNPSCSNTYIVKSGDSCDAITLAHQVSTFSIIKAGGLRNDCKYDLYQLYNYASKTNGLFSSSPPGGNNSDITITVAPPTTTTIESTAVPKPTNGKGDTTAPCASWYTVQDGDYCESISIRRNIALQDLYFLNPSTDSKCLNLWLNTAYCVKAVGDINTYRGYPYSSSAVYTLTKPAYVTTTSVLTPIVPTATPVVDLLHAPGTKSEFPYEDFLEWNPSLASIQPCYLQPNYSYCAVDSIAAYTAVPNYGHCRYVDDGYPGTISTCDCFTIITGSAAKSPSCAKIALDADIALSDLTRWNPWVGSSCDDGLFKDLEFNKERAVCIGANLTDMSPITTRTTSITSAGTTSSTRSITTSVAPPAPTQNGIPKSCTAYYTAVRGDGCWAIATNHSITLDQFYAWNPAVGNDCANLWPNYSYCVAA